jgi:ABC-type long-subunit fatty acid transport system fused permease/ATPase subunit
MIDGTVETVANVMVLLILFWCVIALVVISVVAVKFGWELFAEWRLDRAVRKELADDSWLNLTDDM